MMGKILVGGAGGAPSEGVIRSLQRGAKRETVIGMGSEPTDLALSTAGSKYLVPRADAPAYKEALLKVIRKESPQLVHFQNDLEVFHASLLRDEIESAGARVFMPEHNVIDTCVSKLKSHQVLERAGLKVPRNILLQNEKDLRTAFSELGNEEGRVWFRYSGIGGAGKGAISTADFQLASAWISHHDGWGQFLAAEMLTEKTVTWSSIWYQGELIVAQSRERRGWVHGDRSISGVTGVTKVGVTCDDETVNATAMNSVLAVSEVPHGIFSVDMAYDREGHPNTTEINISRFFTTILFFTEAGLNLPEIYKDIAVYGQFPSLKKKINPLPAGLIWLRGMDSQPRLLQAEEDPGFKVLD